MFSLGCEYELKTSTSYDCIKNPAFVIGAAWITHGYNFSSLHLSIAKESFSLLYFSN